MLSHDYATWKIEHSAHLAAAEHHRRTRAQTRRHPTVRAVTRYLGAALLLPALFAGWSAATGLLPARAEPTAVTAAPEPPAHDPDKLTAVIVAGSTGAESLDVLAPYEILAASGRFNTYTIAPERRPLPLFPGSPVLRGVDFLPHHSFDSYARDIVTTPDLVVLPYIPQARGPENQQMLAWLRQHVTADTTLLTICGGSWVAADAGLLDGRTATTHRNLFAALEKQHPNVEWVQDERWVEDGNLISSAGISAAVDATLRTIERLVGRAVTEATANAIGYPHLALLDDPRYTVPTAGTSARTINTLARPDRARLGVALYDGVSELDVASIVDLYPRTLASTIHPIGVGSGPISTRHGLHLVPRDQLTQPPSVDRLLVPGSPPPDIRRQLEATPDLPIGDRIHAAADVFAFDAVLTDIARHDSRAAARLVATGIEYPADLASHLGRRWPVELLLRPIVLAGLGLLAAASLRPKRQREALA